MCSESACVNQLIISTPKHNQKVSCFLSHNTLHYDSQSEDEELCKIDDDEEDEHLVKVHLDEDERLAKIQQEEEERLAKIQQEDECLAKIQQEDERLAKAQLEEDEQLARAIQESLKIGSPPQYDNGSSILSFPHLFPPGYR